MLLLVLLRSARRHGAVHPKSAGREANRVIGTDLHRREGARRSVQHDRRRRHVHVAFLEGGPGSGVLGRRQDLARPLRLVRRSACTPYVTSCTDAEDKGLDKVAGRVQVGPYTGDNPLYRHGPIRVAADRRHFEHADGTPFFWLGDTWWMGLCERLKWPDEFHTLAADRKAKGFTVVQIVAGLYPDMPAFDPRGKNEAGFPWTEDYGQIRPEYFDQADRRLAHLVDQGLVPCVVMAWGYHLPWTGVEKMKKHVRYVMARYGALPVVWCMAGEVNLPYYLEKGFPRGGEKQTADWEGVIRYARTHQRLRAG